MSTVIPESEAFLVADEAKLCNEARAVAERAHVPYSGFHVGAAILGAQGTHAAANVESASYGLSLCAERAAIARAVAVGDMHLRVIAVACIDAKESQGLEELLPCGACRQWMAELAAGATVLICGPLGNVYRLTVADLIPMPFLLGEERAVGAISTSS
jgi:cytidine deaminase